MAKGDQPWHDKATIEKAYRDNSIGEIATEWGCSKETIHRWLKRHGVERRSQSAAQTLSYAVMEIDRDGYERWRCYNGTGHNYVRVHRLAAVAWFGFDAVAGKEIHHETHVPWDNREGNLTLMTKAEHAAHHRSAEANHV